MGDKSYLPHTHHGIVNSFFSDRFKESFWNDIKSLDKNNYNYWVEIYEITGKSIIFGKYQDDNKLIYKKSFEKQK